MSRPIATRVQYAALPYRRKNASTIEVLLVTSRETKRWVIPKGWPKKRLKPCHSAAHEAREEAGVVGVVATEPIGSYSYEKRLKSGNIVTCEVQVFPLKVVRQQRSWPEKGQREISWFAPDRASEAVREPLLATIISGFGQER